MQISDRKDIRDFIVDIENRFQVNDWKFNDIHIWPLLRFMLYFHLIFKTEQSDPEEKTFSSPEPSAQKINPVKKLYYYLQTSKLFFRWLSSLRKVRYLFVGAFAHRAELEGVFYNKFYDPLIQKYNLTDFSLLEYTENKEKKINHSEKSIQFLYGFRLFTYYYKLTKPFNKKNKIELEGYPEFTDFLKTNELTKDFAEKRSREQVTEYLNNHLDIRYRFVLMVIKKIRPEYLFILCYYTEFGMLLAAIANQYKIKTIEMQHGPQTNIHMAYSNWSNLPDKGYDMLPGMYWNWDKSSAEVINSTFKNNSNYSAFVGGNPWFDFDFRKKAPEEPFIFYTMQPSPVEISMLLSSNIIEAIKRSNYQWYLRFHPRQSEQEKEEIFKIIQENSLDDKVEFEKANSYPLPLLLRSCLFNVTHFSGTIIEADMLNKKTVLLNKIGKESFESRIENGMAVYIDYDRHDFQDRFSEFESRLNDHSEKSESKIDTHFINTIFNS
ncbi:hypothetical protein HNP38_001897 [Chryseobacterium defluvii]|uniref:Uncharacterized protein n=1 Tax=Chryseobacterium defluvii TaxID=160396 RepID=A0A840KAZ5_9FLAO|nr:hypothetical protein [Chryseobacterium defluvii]MBB4806601.1 hypothetical protein [Chryseobacterium defluvii]